MTQPIQHELIREDYGELNVIFVHSKIDDLGLSVFAFRVYAHLARRASRSGCAWPSIGTMARICRIGETKVREALKELDARRMIARQPRENQTYLVRLTPPSIWREEGFATRTPSPREPVRDGAPPGSPREPEGDPLKDISTGEDLAGFGDDRANQESAARSANARELKRTFPPPLITAAFREAWEKWVIHWTMTFNKGEPIPFSVADAHLKICREIGEKRAIAAIEHTIGCGLRKLCEPNSKNANNSRTNTRSFAQTGDYSGVTDK